MCGIVGILKKQASNSGDEQRRILLRMRERLLHRGPDDAGLWDDGRCFLGHRRLSIMDVTAAGHQPMATPDGNIHVVYNGEIYNHQELRQRLEERGSVFHSHCDTETLLHGYLHEGVKFFDQAVGMWAVALWDHREPARPRLHLIRDRIGIKPLYLTRTGSGDWLFASEIKALLEHPDVTAQMDRTALWHYLTFIVAPAPLTMFRGIFKIPAGWRVEIDHLGRATAHQWWDCKPDAREIFDPAQVSEAETEARFLAVLRDSIRLRMVSDVPFGALLSGGVDSSLIVALMSELMDRPVTTFSIGYEGQEDYNEFRFAREVAKKYRTDHHETLINRRQIQEFIPTLIDVQDEPIADNVCIPLYFLAKLVRDSGTTVVQVGEGADENWLGYWWCEHYRRKYEELYRPNRQVRRWDGLRRLLGRALLRPDGNPASEEDRWIVERARDGRELFWGGAVCWWGEIRRKLTPQAEPFRSAVDCPIEGLPVGGVSQLDSHAVVKEFVGDLTGRLPEPEVLYKLPYLEHKLRLSEHLLMRVDKFTMAHSIEARVPFLDHRVVDLARRVPAGHKLKDGIGKYILKKAAEPFLPEAIIYRKKQGFGAPMEEWFKEGDFGPMCLAAFERSPLCTQKLVDADFVRGMFKHQMGDGGGFSFHLWTLMNLVFWHEKWIG